jgi:hypothetical protein
MRVLDKYASESQGIAESAGSIVCWQRAAFAESGSWYPAPWELEGILSSIWKWHSITKAWRACEWGRTEPDLLPTMFRRVRALYRLDAEI